MSNTIKKCGSCGRPLVPVQVTESVKVDKAVWYADNLCAIDGMAGTLVKAWACRHTCEEPIPIDNTAEAEKDWAEAWLSSKVALAGRPERS